MPQPQRDPTAELKPEFGRILEDSLNEIYIFSAKDLRFLQVNRGARENLGYSMEELSQLTPLDIKRDFTAEHFEALLAPLRSGATKKVEFETFHHRKDGSTYSVEVHLQLSSYHDAPAFVAIILDTTDRKRTEQDLRLRNRAIEAMGTGLVITDPTQHDNPMIYCNQAFEHITGYPASEVIGRNCRLLQQDDRNQAAIDVMRDAVKSGRECQVVLRNYRKDGTAFWNDLKISPVRNPQGRITNFVGSIRDVTSRVESEEAARDREARLQAILDNAVEAIITIDERGICESLNAAAEKMFGFREDEVIGKNISMLMPEPYHEEHDSYLANYCRSGERKIIGIGREVVGQRRDGTPFPIHLSVSEVHLEDRRVFTGIIQDITERKETQRRLVQSERLAAVGEAMSRLAHEGRNSLQRIQIAVETSRLDAAEGSDLAKQLDAIETASDGLNALLDEMRNFAAPVNLEKEDAPLDEVWREAWQSVSPLRAGREVDLEHDSQVSSHVCRIDRFRIGQLFRNLFENSLAACRDPVRISLSVTELRRDNGPALLVRFCDNGPGLSEEQRSRIFEPFYTTKSKGTGLGMAIARRNVEAHGGKICAGPAQQGGAEFLIELPK